MKNTRKGSAGIAAILIGALIAFSAGMYANHQIQVEQRAINEQISEIDGQVSSLQAGLGDQISLGSSLFVRANPTTLAAPIAASDTSITLTKLVTPDEQELSMSDFGTLGFATIEPGNSSKVEFISFTSITQDSSSNRATLTGVTRGLQFKSPYTASSTLRQSHSGNVRVVISNPPQLYDTQVSKVNDSTVSSTVTYNAIPVFNSAITSSSFTNSQHFVSRAYVDAKAFGVVPESSEAASGFVELATGAEAASSTQSGSIARLAVPTAITTSTAPSSGHVIPVTGLDGNISINFIDSQYLPPVGSITAYASTTAPTGWLSADGSAVSRSTYASLYAVIGTTYGAGDGSTTFNVPNLKSVFPLGSGQRTEAITFLDGNVNTGSDLITVSSTVWLTTGQAVTLSTSGVLPTGLSATTTYYAIRDSATTTKLAISLANANAGTAVDITAASGGGTHTMTVTLTNRTIADEGGEETHLLTPSQLPSHTHNVQNVAKSTGGSNILDGSGDDGFGTATSDANANGDTTANNMPPFVVVHYIIKY